MLFGPITSVPLLFAASIAGPAYCSFKSLHGKDDAARKRWLQYWLVLALIQPVLSILEPLFSSFVPMWYELKILAAAWLAVDKYQGASVLCTNYVEPFLTKHEARCDETLSFAVAKAQDLKVEDARALVEFVKAKASALGCCDCAGASACATACDDADIIKDTKPKKAVESKPAVEVEKPSSPTGEPDDGVEVTHDHALDATEETKKEK